MAAFHFDLHTTRHSTSIKPVRLPALAERIEIWTMAGLLLLSVGVVCLNTVWATSMWQTLLFVLTIVAAFRMSSAVSGRAALPLLAACCIPLWGTVQMLLGTAAYRYATLLATMGWAVIPACMLLGLALFQSRLGRDAFLRCLWTVSVVMVAVELFQLFVLGRFTVTSTGLPLMSSNFYAELAELLLPVVLVTALRKGERLWLGCGLAALMAGTTFAAGARAGSALIVLEIVAIFAVTRSKSGYEKLSWKQHGIPMATLLLLAVGLLGASNLAEHLKEVNPFTERNEVAQSSLEMIRARPVTGYGLGSFAVVYPQFSHFETAYYINHAHNDYLELTASGGVVALAFWILLLACTLPAAARTPWAFGVFGILLHSFTDFPLYRLPVAALFAMLLAAANGRIEQQKSTQPVLATAEVAPGV